MTDTDKTPAPEQPDTPANNAGSSPAGAADNATDGASADAAPDQGATLPSEEQGALLSDLQSVRALLDPEAAGPDAAPAEAAPVPADSTTPAPPAAEEPAADASSVPTLEEPIGGANWVDRLLDEQWQDASSAVMADARERLRDLGLADDDPDTRALVDQLASELGRLLPDKLHATVDAELQAFRIALMNRLRIEVADLVDLLINDLTDPDRDAPMDKAFDPHAIEQDLYQQWEAKGYFAPGGSGDPYCVMIPPPNVTGSLHMGHAFQDTLMDTLVRWRRMQGRNTLWQVGMDHAGIATQMVVERQLEQVQQTKEDLGRDGFIDKVWEWKKTSGGQITKQLRRMGASVDWSRERFTMDEGFSAAVQTVFVKLYSEGLIYRGQRLVNWDPELGTAISDLEVENVQEQGHLWHFRYPLADGATTADGKDHLVVATTRPETMLGDTAVAVHPEDERFKDLVGQEVALPLTGRRIPIIADDYVDMEFGSGCVKITPAHDFNDYEMGNRHQLPRINIFTDRAVVNDNAPAAFQGLDRVAARKAVVEALDGLGLLEKIDDHSLQVPRGDRSGAVIEPWLTDQWFVAIEELAKPAIKAVEDGAIEFVPKQNENLYFAWMRDIRDWCISRQLWWGHRIPAWYDNSGKVYVGDSEAAVRASHNLGDDVALRQDPDVLETWFSSALWTFGTLGWPEDTEELRTFHPTDVLVTGHDIIFFWVARMIMLTLKFTGEVPFRKVYIHGLVRDAEGQKMSKSKGNGLDPLDLISGTTLDDLLAKRTDGMMQPQLAKKIAKATRRDFPDGIPSFGTDALRFTFCALASTGRDVRFDLNRITGYRDFCNKLWNAARFVQMNCDDQDCGAGLEVGDPALAHGLPERWILSRLQQCLAEADRALETFRFDLLAGTLYDFVWHEYCDWYLELAKPVLYDEAADPARQRATRHTLLTVLETVSRALHPVMPFITETLWQQIAPALAADGKAPADSIMLAPFPLADDSRVDRAADADIEWVKGVIMGVRNIRGEMNISPAVQVPVLFQGGDAEDQRRLEDNALFLAKLAKLSETTWLGVADAPPCATALVGDMKVLVPMAGLIDVAAEQERLGKELARRQADLQRLDGKLGNANFVDRAPAEVVAKERQKRADAAAAVAQLEAQMATLADL